MALKNCKECGNEISNKAESCPKCGAKFPRTKFLTKVMAGLFGIVGVVVLVNAGKSSGPSDPPLTAEQKAANAKYSAALQRASLAAASVKKALREPDSVQWESIRANDDASLVCLEYRARNGFGGMGREFAILQNDKFTQSRAVWNQRCTKPLTDMISARHGI